MASRYQTGDFDATLSSPGNPLQSGLPMSTANAVNVRKVSALS